MVFEVRDLGGFDGWLDLHGPVLTVLTVWVLVLAALAVVMASATFGRQWSRTRHPDWGKIAPPLLF